MKDWERTQNFINNKVQRKDSTLSLMSLSDFYANKMAEKSQRSNLNE